MLFFSFKVVQESIDFDDAVDLRDEPKRGEKSNRASEEKENEGQQEGVSEVKYRRCRPLDGQLGNEVMNAVQEEIKGGKAGSKERAPPPVIVLGA